MCFSYILSILDKSEKKKFLFSFWVDTNLLNFIGDKEIISDFGEIVLWLLLKE